MSPSLRVVLSFVGYLSVVALAVAVWTLLDWVVKYNDALRDIWWWLSLVGSVALLIIIFLWLIVPAFPRKNKRNDR